MASHEIKPLSKSAKLHLQLCSFLILLSTLLGTLANCVPLHAAGWPLKRILAIRYLRSVSWLPFNLSRNSKPATGQTIAAYAKAQGLICESKTIGSSESSESPGRLHFIQLRETSSEPKILLYFHGGAYVNPIDGRGQLPFVVDSARAAAASKVALLEYTLAPEMKYPGQLRQAVEALEDILQTYDPSQISLGGDSAGGNLLLAVFAHIKQPHPDIRPLRLKTPFAAAYLISPWVRPSHEARSFSTNSSFDYISASGVTAWIGMWSPRVSEVWADASRGGSEFWQDIPAKSLLVTAGSWEVFLDDIVTLAHQLGAQEPSSKGSRVEFVVGEKEVHVQCAVDKGLGLPYGHTASKILSWLESGVDDKN